MSDYQQLKQTLASTNFTIDWQRFTVTFRYMMETIYQFTLTEQRQVRAKFH